MSASSFLPGDFLPDGPELARRGPYAVGVTTRTIMLAGAINLSACTATHTARGARELTAQIWYPAVAGADESCRYDDHLGREAGDPERPATAFSFRGRAARNAVSAAMRSPLVVVSHGYPGSRVLLSYLCEHMASCGRVVMALDHPGSVHGAVGDFAETLLHRPTDILGAMDAAEHLDLSDAVLRGRIDAQRTLLLGYSMGGYGVLNAAGAGFSDAYVKHPQTVPHGLLGHRGAASLAAPDPRVCGVVAFAPWGGQHKVWDAQGLGRLQVPILFVAGSDDDVVGWAPGVQTLFTACAGAERFMLVFQNARHNIAPNPPPDIAATHAADWAHYAEPNWDLRRIDNINQHFVRGFMDYALTDDGTALPPALDLVPRADQGGWTASPDGALTPDKEHWWGFAPRTAIGLELHHLTPDN